MLVVRDAKLLKPANRQLTAKENENRTTVIIRMVRLSSGPIVFVIHRYSSLTDQT